MKDVYLVQRLLIRDPEDDTNKGIDKFFALDYMGSAEFEFGACNYALKAMAHHIADITEVPKRIKVECEGDFFTVWYIGKEDNFSIAKSFFEDQLSSSRNWKLKEPSFIRESMGKIESRWSIEKCYAGWWAIQTDYRPPTELNPDRNSGTMVPWGIFKQKSYAQNFRNEISDYANRNRWKI